MNNLPQKNHPKKNIEFIVCCIVIVLFTLVLFIDGINTMTYQCLAYDEAYNATVAANMMRHGSYRASYPFDITFYNIITTGVSVILPTAFLFTHFGVNSLTASVVAMIYSALSILSIWYLLGKSLPGKKGTFTVSTVLTILLILSTHLFEYISTHLIGETACIFFLVMSCIFFLHYYEKKKALYMMLAGAMVAFSFLTKSSMIFFVVSFSGMVLIEALIMRAVTIKGCLGYFLGFGAGFIAMDSYKLVQLGGLSKYAAWWSDEWTNMLSQSSGTDTALGLKAKIDYLESLFVGSNKYFCLLMIALPVIIYALVFFAKLLRKEAAVSAGTKTMLIGGIGGASLLVYFLLLGSSGLAYSRRLIVNGIFVKLFFAYAIGFACLKLIDLLMEKDRSKKRISKTAALAVLCCLSIPLAFPWSKIHTNIASYKNQFTQNEYSQQQMLTFIDEVRQLEENAVLYCGGWWQEPNVTLYLDRDMINVYTAATTPVPAESPRYFIVGSFLGGITKSQAEACLNGKLVRVDTSEVDYYQHYDTFGRQDFELFAIYRVEPNTPSN